jgi:uncharacterized membrane protein
MKIGTTRVETFSDGVIAIIITIMVLSLKLPDINHRDSAWTVRHQLYELIPYFVTYVFSFMMIGIFWVNHHHMFHMLDKTDERLLLLNLLFMFWMSLIPLSTAMMGANPQVPDSVALYGFIMLMTTLSFAFMRTYTINKNLVHQDDNQDISGKIRWVSLKGRTKSYIGTAAYFCSVPLAYLDVYVAYFFFLIAPVIFFIPDGIDDERLAAKIEEKNNGSA